MLSWNEIRARAAAFAAEWANATYEKGESQPFYVDFFNVFGVKRRRVATFEQQVKKLDGGQGFIDVFWPGVLLVEQKSAGRDLAAARIQASDYCAALREKEHPRFVLLSDFQSFELFDLESGEEWSFTLEELPDYVQAFGFILGRQKRSFREQPAANIKASELLGAVHDALKDTNYRDHDLQRYLVRLLFCMFADDTGIFEPRGIFETYLKERTEEDGSDLGGKLAHFFQVLDTPEEERAKGLDEELAQFPYVNGELFSETLRIPSFDTAGRKALIEACEFAWETVSPAIFGSLFQSVMNADERRSKGAHYTSEANIMKVIGPLFLDDLQAEFKNLKKLKNHRTKLLAAFQHKLGELTFLDPACGCGNFLVIAYRELRALELEVLVELYPEGQRVLDVDALTVLNVDQFYGIELEEFPARIAEVAMWMADHIANNALSAQFGQVFTRIPLKASPHIVHADALEVDWEDVLPAERCSYVFGNPPFLGAKIQTAEQREQVRDIAKLGKSGGTLDFVAAWFIKAGAYVQGGDAAIAFVSTNSITNGEQVAQLFPILFDRHKLEIAFAHRTFAWDSEARGKAHVHVVIVGLTKAANEPSQKRLFSYETVKSEAEETPHGAITAYLTGADTVANRHLVVESVSKPINGARELLTGTQPLEDGNLTFNAEEKSAFVAQEVLAEQWLKPFPGAYEFLNGRERWILDLSEAKPAELRQLPVSLERLNNVREFRQKSSRATTKRLSEYPTAFGVTVIPKSSFLALPQVSSERREYVPFGWLQPPTIPSEKLRVLLDASISEFAILTSAMHMAWMRAITGRMKSDYMYSVGVVYNTFPWPELTPTKEAKISELAQAVLDAREQFPGSTLADLYDPDLMPPALRKAHQALDRAVDRLYRAKPFDSERERVEHLFGLYEKMVAPVEAAAKAKPKRKRKPATG